MPSDLDLFATKGIEYLLVIGFLATLILFWRMLNRAPGPVRVAQAAAARTPWFRLAARAFYHQGHTWALPGADDVVTVGIDDFAQKLLGRPTSVEVPAVGRRLEQGGRALTLRVGGAAFELLSPVAGEVVAVNDEVLRSPGLVNEDPYGRGWILKARVKRLKSNLKNLLSGHLAEAWMEDTVAALRGRMAGGLGAVLQDGGAPVSGMARELAPEEWEEVARRFLLCD